MERIEFTSDPNDPELYDVVEVDIPTGEVMLMGEGKTARNAEAIERFAIMRRSTDENFFAVVPAGKYADGDRWECDE